MKKHFRHPIEQKTKHQLSKYYCHSNSSSSCYQQQQTTPKRKPPINYLINEQKTANKSIRLQNSAQLTPKNKPLLSNRKKHQVNVQQQSGYKPKGQLWFYQSQVRQEQITVNSIQLTIPKKQQIFARSVQSPNKQAKEVSIYCYEESEQLDEKVTQQSYLCEEEPVKSNLTSSRYPYFQQNDQQNLSGQQINSSLSLKYHKQSMSPQAQTSKYDLIEPKLNQSQCPTPKLSLTQKATQLQEQKFKAIKQTFQAQQKVKKEYFQSLLSQNISAQQVLSFQQLQKLYLRLRHTEPMRHWRQLIQRQWCYRLARKAQKQYLHQSVTV